MKHFFALPALLRTATLLAAASQRTFSVGDDILAFPQYDIRFSDAYTSEQEAQDRVQQHHDERGSDTKLQPDQDASSSQVGQYSPTPSSNRDPEIVGDEEDSFDYEYMVLDGQRWLCALPKVQDSKDAGAAFNETQARVDEEKELARATDRGWELLSGMQDNCVFFNAGWWSYSFCYNKGVKQFHQLPPGGVVPRYPPVEDPGVTGFTLGAYEKGGKEKKRDGIQGAVERPWTKHGSELVQRGESRYLVQRLGGGTTCDITGKERRIEVQFHCNPQASDRISLIKETSTCAYLMVIQTPRLCNDVAFQPPRKDQPNTISCSPILTEEEIPEYERNLKAAQSEREATQNVLTAPAFGEEDWQVVGDIVIGAHSLVPEGQIISKSTIVGGKGKETYVDTVASSDGKGLSKQDLEKLGLTDDKAIERLKKELEKYAQGAQWKLDIIDTPRGREYRGIIGEEGEEETGQGEGEKEGEEKQKKEGSEEEYYKEEL